MRWLEFVLMLLVLEHTIKTGRISGLQYVTQILRRILKNSIRNKFTMKPQSVQLLLLVDISCETSYDAWMSTLERTKTSINN
ncbi:unnamed protein product [Rotaria magnacalcarata]|uniref:Secreted protein n=1 Tax=Rotaria magnacalcarata TaxID=392030 RepID=A0A816W5W8_9BILA|nr:unnamed protein product [Rotaria magnacalcarata]CAF2129195.1 unnamed protein product [Rotaria magnacalcarata]